MDACRQNNKQGDGPRADLGWMCCFVRVAAFTRESKEPVEDFEQLLSFDSETLVRFCILLHMLIYLFYFIETCF